jgi:hypothetical protein
MGATYLTAILIEIIENKGEFLQTSHLPEPLHCAPFSSEWMV